MVHLKLEQWEPGESRGSRRVLRAAKGAVPLADSPALSRRRDITIGVTDIIDMIIRVATVIENTWELCSKADGLNLNLDDSRVFVTCVWCAFRFH